MAKSSGSRYRLLLTLLLLATGCYHGPYRGVLGGGIDTIAIPFVGNQTAEYAAADSLIRATVVAFREDGQLRLADEGGPTPSSISTSSPLMIASTPGVEYWGNTRSLWWSPSR